MARTISKTFLDQGAYLRAMDVRPTASEGEKLWAVQTLSGQWGFQHLPDSVRTNPGDFLPKLQEAIRVRSLRPVMTEDAEETENLWKAANEGTQEAWDELAKRSVENDSVWTQIGDKYKSLSKEEAESAAGLMQEYPAFLKPGKQYGDQWFPLDDMPLVETVETGATNGEISYGYDFEPWRKEARKRLAAARHVERVRQKNAFSMLAAIQGELGEEAKGIIDRAVANGYKLVDGDAELFALPEERGGIPEEQKRLAASFLRYCKPVEGSHWWSAFGKRFSDSAGQVTWSGVEELGDLFSGIAHGFDSDNYRDRVQKRAWTRTINARNFADLGWLGNSFAEAGTIMGYWTPQLVGMAAGYGMGALGGAMARGGGAVARVGAAMARGAGAMARWTPEAMYFADYREQFLTRVAMDGGDVTDPAFQVCATVGGIASAYVEHLQWGMAMGKIGLAEVQAQAYSRLTHRLLGKLGVKVGTEFGGMGAGRALGIVLAERLAVVGTEGLEEALQQAIEEVVVDVGDGKTVRLADIAETSAETFVQTLGPMVWTMFNPVALGGRAKSAATMHNLDQGAIERLMSAGERLKSLAEQGKLTDGREDLGALNQLMFAVTRAPNGAAALNALRSRGFTTPQAEAMVGTFEAIRREAIERGQLDVLGTNVLPTGEELERTGWVRNEDGSFSRDVEAEDGKRRRQTIVVENVASRAVDTTDDAEADSLLNTMRQRAEWTVPLNGQRTTYAERLAAMGIDLARSNADLLADPRARAAMAAEVAANAEMDYRISGDTRFRETRQAQDPNGNAVEEDVFDIALTERATRETIFHEVAHAVAKTLRNMGLTEKEIDAIQNWRSGQDGRAPNAADMALPEYTVEGKTGASELWDEERVGDEMGAALAGADDAAKGRVAKAMNHIGDIVRRVLGIQKERKAMHDAVAAMEEVVRSGHWGNIDNLTEAQKRLLMEARQRRAEARERQQAQQPEARPAESAVVAPTPPEEAGPSPDTAVPSSEAEGPSSEEQGTPPDMGKSAIDRISEAFCFNRPLLRADMAQLAASGQLSEADIYETGYRWSPLLRCWTVRPECRNQPFTPNGAYMGLDGEWKGETARAMVAATQHSLEALEDIANGKEFGILHNAVYGEIHYPLGKFGRIKKNGKTDGGLGLLHIVSERMRKDDATLEEAIETAVRVGIAAEIGEETASIENTRWLDFDGTRAIIALTDNGNPIITGYEIHADETSAAFPSSEALQRQPLMREADIVAALKERLALERQDVNSENPDRASVSPRQPSPEFAMDGTIADALPAHLREDARAIIAERAGTPSWMVEPDGTPTVLNERDWLRREAGKRHGLKRFAVAHGNNLIAVHYLSTDDYFKVIDADGKLMAPSISVSDANFPRHWGKAGSGVLLAMKPEIVAANSPDVDLFGSDAGTPMVNFLDDEDVRDAESTVAKLKELRGQEADNVLQGYRYFQNTREDAMMLVDVLAMRKLGGIGQTQRTMLARPFQKEEVEHLYDKVLAVGQRHGNGALKLMFEAAFENLGKKEIQERLAALAIGKRPSAFSKAATDILNAIKEIDSASKAYLEAKVYRAVPLTDAALAIVGSEDAGEIGGDLEARGIKVVVADTKEEVASALQQHAPRFAVSGLYTGSAAEYANRDVHGNIVNGPSLHYIGEGEGNQAFGWGLYASNSFGIASGYARRDVRNKGNYERQYLSNAKSLISAYSKLGMDKAAMLAALEEGRKLSIERYGNPRLTTYYLAEKLIENPDYEPKATANLYEQTFFTNRATPEETERHLLKWYEPVSEEQMGWVKEELRAEGLSETTDGWELGQADGWMLYKMLEDKFGSAKGASEFLARAGIDGVKYPVDSYGKTVKDGDNAGWNYVSFRDDNIRVDHKWVNGEQRYQIAGRAGAERLGMRGLGDAEAMERSGATREEIWRETGWWRGADGKWRVEIPDIRLKSVEEVQAAIGKGRVAQLDEIVEAPNLFTAYPLLRKVEVSVADKMAFDESGEAHADTPDVADEDRYDFIRVSKRNNTVEKLTSVLAHEIQHVVQTYEGLEHGAPNGERAWMGDSRPLAVQALEELRIKLPGWDENTLQSLAGDWVHTHVAGEVEARNVQKRLFMSPEERASTPPWETEDVPDGEQIVRHSVAPRGAQKEAGTEYPDAGEEIGGARFAIGSGRRAEYARLLAKHRPDLDAEKVLSELDKYGNPKKEKAALHWVVRGTVILPEDEYKVDDALAVAEKAKVDPFAYDSPMALLQAHKEYKPPTHGPIDPDTVPELSDKRDMGYGITTYLVQDDEAGQKAMREILNAAYGKDFSPWCLLHGDGKGGLSSQAWGYWHDTYNSLPKRVAFQNGKPIAFMATRGDYRQEQLEITFAEETGLDAAAHPARFKRWMRENGYSSTVPEQWWDTNDNSHDGIPALVPVEGDPLGRSHHAEIQSDGTIEEWPGGWERHSDGIDEEWVGYSYNRTEKTDGGQKKTTWYFSGAVGHEETIDVEDNRGHELKERLVRASLQTNGAFQYGEGSREEIQKGHLDPFAAANLFGTFAGGKVTFAEGSLGAIAIQAKLDPGTGEWNIQHKGDIGEAELRRKFDAWREKFEALMARPADSIGPEERQEGDASRSAVEGRVRAFDDVPKYSTRGTLAALATLSYIAGEEPDAANLEEVGRRLGGDVSVPEVLADAKTVHDGLLGKLTQKENRIIAAVARKVGQAGKMKPGEVAKIVAEAVQAMHPEDLVREAYMRGAAAQDWAQGTRGAALNALVRQSRWDNYADMVTETGLDATGVLHRMILQKEATPATDGEGAGTGEGAGQEEKVPDGSVGPQSRELYEAAEALTAEQEANLELALSEANAEMEERRADAEERERRAAEEVEAPDDADDEADGGDVEEGDDSGVADEIKIPAEMLERHLVDVRDPATFACLLRKIIRNRILKANGAGADFAGDLEAAHRAERELWANPTNVGMFAKSMAAILRDMAKRMLEHGSGAYTEIIRKAAVLPHYDDVDAIEKEVEFEVRVLARASIRQTSARIVNHARETLKRYIGPSKRGEHPELEEDLTRKITGHVREMAKWYRRVLSMSEGQVVRARDGWTDKDGVHHAGLEEILRERGRELDDAGMGGQAGLDSDAVWSKAAWRLAVLNRYGGTRYLLPMEARERCAEIETWMAKEALAWAEKTARLQARYEADRKTIIEGCAVVDRATGQKRKWEEDTKADRLWRFTVNTINQRLRYLFARASGKTGQAAQELLQRYSLELSRGTTRYIREMQEMRRDLVLAVRSVVGKRGVRKWLERMLEEIPEAHAVALSKQGNRHLTFGQVMHLYGYLRQTATYGENIAKHGREWQRDYIERNVLRPEDLKILNLMMKIYADRRVRLDEASRDITGFPMLNPDPFYMPVQIKRKAQSGLETVVSTVQAMPSVFSERRNHGLDVDEKADVMVIFQDRMEKTARVLAFGRTGLDIIHTFGSGEVKDAITEARGPKFTTALIRHFTDWMNGGRPRLTNGEGADSKFLNSLRTIAVYQGLWGNTLTAFKQTLSAPVFSLAREIGERGIFQDMAGRFEEGWKQAKVELTQSEPWKARYGDVGIMQETQEAVLGAGEGTIWKALLRAGMEPLQKGDATPGILCQVTAYMVERDKLIEGGMDPEEAKRLAADKAMQQVEWTQQSSRAENLPEYSRRGDSGIRMLMMFASSPMLQAGWEMQRYVEWREKRDAFGTGSKEAGDAAKTFWNAIIVNHVVMPILFQAATMVFNGILGKKEPDEDDLKELVFSMMIGPFARLAFIGGTMKAVYDAATGRGVYGRSDAAPSMLVNNSRNAVDLLATIPMDVFSGDMEAVWKDLDRFLKRNLAPYRHARKAWEAWGED